MLRFDASKRRQVYTSDRRVPVLFEVGCEELSSLLDKLFVFKAFIEIIPRSDEGIRGRELRIRAGRYDGPHEDENEPESELPTHEGEVYTRG
jgi:hypothetical protein